jgi:hypothetical protein
VLTPIGFQVLLKLKIRIEGDIAVVMRCSVQAVEQMIVATRMLGRFSMARMVTNLGVQYLCPATKFRLSGLSSMNQVYT